VGRHRAPGDLLGLVTAAIMVVLLLCLLVMIWAPSGRYIHDAVTLAVALWPW
jgi:phosphotransferase system  glucose/maltose/N-acetylglucosamine-specific IIC component